MASINEEISLQSKRISLAILIALAGINAIWSLTSSFRGPIFASIIYAFVAYLCWSKNDFKAVIIIAMAGFIVHMYELIARGVQSLYKLEVIFFFTNLILPVILAYAGVRAYNAERRKNI